MEHERETWNRRYREGSHPSLDPDPLLPQSYAEFVTPLFPGGGSAFDVAGGIGRHAIWLARRHWQVTLADISPVGIDQARHHAGDLANHINFQVADLADFVAGTKSYDLLLVFFYLERKIFPELVKVLRPGGLLIYKTYTRENPRFGRGPTHSQHLLANNELLHAFPGLRVLYYQETIRDRGVAEFVGRKA